VAVDLEKDVAILEIGPRGRTVGSDVSYERSFGFTSVKGLGDARGESCGRMPRYPRDASDRETTLTVGGGFSPESVAALTAKKPMAAKDAA
jgi:hypothetical protein